MCYCASIRLSYDTGIRLLLFSCVTVCRCSWTCRRYGTVSWRKWRKSLQADSVSYTVRNTQRGKQLHTRNWQLCSSQPDHGSFTLLLQCCLFTAYIYPAGRSGLVVTCITAVWADPGSNRTMDSCVVPTCPQQPLRYTALRRNLTAVPRSGQRSTVCGMVKWVTSFWAEYSKWR